MSEEKNSRINMRLTQRQRELLKDAASISGTSVSDFVLVPALERAHQLVMASAVTRIRSDAAQEFKAWLDAPAESIAAMAPLRDADPLQGA